MGRRDTLIINNVLITAVAAEGKSLAHVDGKVLFVSGAIPGDKVKVQVTHRRRSFMEGYVLELLEPSPVRLQPFCSHFGVCGGCKWQTLPYDLQVQYKQQQVVDQLTRIGHLTPPPPEPVLKSAKTLYYRNKLEFSFSNRAWFSKEELASGAVLEPRPALGFHITGLFDKVLDIEHCYLQPEPSNAIRTAVKGYALEHGLSFFDLKKQEGFLRTLLIRTNSSGEVMLTLVFAFDNPEVGEGEKARKDLLEFIKCKFKEIKSLNYIINTKRNDSLSDLPVHLYSGEEAIYEQMENLRFKIGPKSFFQTNSESAVRLYAKVREYAALTGEEVVYDLYTGMGTIALFLASGAKKVVGIEYIPEAVADAQENAKINGISNAEFFAGDMKDVLTEAFIERQGRPRVVVLDPPRAGVHPSVIDVLIKAAAPRLIYVSCNPATQARDLQLLSAYYKIVKLQAVDMFPHTHHIENIVLCEFTA